MEMRSFELMGSMQLEDAYARIEKVAKASVQAATFLYDGRVLFCAGFHQLWPGVLEVWMIPSVYIRKVPISFGRTIKRYIDRLAEDFKAHRLQTTSYDDPFHAKWMAFLGFENETPNGMKKFTHDQKTMCMYARVKE